MRIVTFTGAPSGGEQLRISINRAKFATVAIRGESLRDAVRRLAEAANNGGGTPLVNRPLCGFGDAPGEIRVMGPHSDAPSWAPTVEASADAPIEVQVG
jgi:hypothetical protein